MIMCFFILSVNDLHCYGLKPRHTFMKPNIAFSSLPAKAVLKYNGVLIQKLTVATSKWIVLNHLYLFQLQSTIRTNKSTKQKNTCKYNVVILVSWLCSLFSNFFLVLFCFNLFHPKLIQMINILSLQFQSFNYYCSAMSEWVKVSFGGKLMIIYSYPSWIRCENFPLSCWWWCVCGIVYDLFHVQQESPTATKLAV